MAGSSVDDWVQAVGGRGGTTTKTVGRMDYRPVDNNWSTEVAVREYAGAAGLAVWVGPVLIDVLLLPEDVDELIGDLEAAKRELDPESVAENQEYVRTYTNEGSYSSSRSPSR